MEFFMYYSLFLHSVEHNCKDTRLFIYPISDTENSMYVYSIERSISRNKTCAHPVCFCCLLDIYLKHLSIKPWGTLDSTLGKGEFNYLNKLLCP